MNPSQLKRRQYMGFPPMAERIQLKEPGSEFVMVVTRVAPETVEGIEYFLFTNGQKELMVPVSSVRSQLERLGADTPADIVGRTVKFSRSTKLSKYGKAFWNLDLASGAEAPSTSVGGGSPPVSAGAPSAEEKPKLAGIYLEATGFILDKIVPLYEEAEIGLSDTAVAAMVHTLFIAKSREL